MKGFKNGSGSLAIALVAAAILASACGTRTGNSESDLKSGEKVDLVLKMSSFEKTELQRISFCLQELALKFSGDRKTELVLGNYIHLDKDGPTTIAKMAVPPGDYTWLSLTVASGCIQVDGTPTPSGFSIENDHGVFSTDEDASYILHFGIMQSIGSHNSTIIINVEKFAEKLAEITRDNELDWFLETFQYWWP